jgi:hypothetical protein
MGQRIPIPRAALDGGARRVCGEKRPDGLGAAQDGGGVDVGVAEFRMFTQQLFRGFEGPGGMSSIERNARRFDEL